MFFTKREYEKLKIDAYEQCPCGSNEKFKFCCYQPAREMRGKENKYRTYSPERIQHTWHKKWTNAERKVCLGFDKDKCKKLIKRAHAIQNNRILNRISVDGHVYKITNEFNKHGPKATLKKISRNKASTFFGFCEYHDTEIFKEIEQKDYKNTLKQNFLFAFRALAYEFHTKIQLLDFLRATYKEEPQMLLDPLSVNTYRIATLDVSDYKQDYEEFKEINNNGSYEQVYTFYRKLEFEVGFSVCAAFSVKYDLEGNLLNDIHHDKSKEKMPSIFVNIYPIDGGTNVLISYNLNDKDIYKSYFNQLNKLSKQELLDYLNYLVIEYTENVFFSPGLIRRMTDQEKESLLRSFESSIYPLEKFELFYENRYYKFNIFKQLHL